MKINPTFVNCTTVIHMTDEVNLKLKQIYVNRTIEKSLSLEVVLHQTGKKRLVILNTKIIINFFVGVFSNRTKSSRYYHEGFIKG